MALPSLRERDNQARESWKSAFGVGLLIMASEDQDGLWESQADVNACLAETGVTRDQVNRWRREGLLPPVMQKPTAYRGSEVFYRVGTCAQIRATKELFGTKNRVDYVGWELWWRGFPADESHWRPKFVEAVKSGDRALRILKMLIVRNERRDSPDTISDRLVHSNPSGSLYLKIKRRIEQGELPTVIGIILDTATSRLDGAIAEELEPALGKALDIGQAQTDQILGKQLRLMNALPGVLYDIARVNERYSLSEVLGFSNVELERARDDVRGALQIIAGLYDATSWIYGPKSFGLRLAAWLANTLSPTSLAFCILIFAARRHDGHEFLSTDEIRKLANDAAQIRRQSEKLRALQKEPRFSEVLSAKRLRRGLRNPDEQWTLLKEIEAARIKK